MTETAITRGDIRHALRSLELSHHAVCVHSSLRSFGRVQGGPEAVIGALLDEGCTMLVPTFTSAYQVDAPPGRRLRRNAWDPDRRLPVSRPPYDISIAEVNTDMGAIPTTVAAMPGRVRGDHPLNSFTAIGPLAEKLVPAQCPDDVYAPLRALADNEGFVVLMGVGLNRMTLIHLAEKLAGRTLFRRWALGRDHGVLECDVGGCSTGFARLGPALAGVTRTSDVGASTWLALPAKEALDVTREAIRADPEITRCPDPACERCADAIAGGPILEPA